jgi:hypothetical protein
LPHQFRFRLVGYAERRIQPDSLVMTADDVEAERVESRNRSTVNERDLPAQMLGFRLLGEPLLDRFSYSLPHFAGGCVRKRRYEQTIDIDRVPLIRYTPYNSFDEYGRLARTRSGCYENV